MGLFGGGNNGGDNEGGIPMNPGARTGLMCLVSGYVMYLGGSIIKGYIDGEPGMPGWMAILFGGLFIVLGGLYLVYNIKNYMAVQKAAQESSDEESEEEEDVPDAAPQEGEENVPDAAPQEDNSDDR